MTESLVRAEQSHPSKRWLGLAFAWGLAEATFFFVVPDVLITRLALQGRFRTALLACIAALLGALIGGGIFWCAAQHDATPRLFRALTYLPGINRELIAETGQALQARGVVVLFRGGVVGQPYKLFALHAGAQNIPLGKFLLASAAARFGRFVLSAAIAWWVGLRLQGWREARIRQLHALGWLGFYLVYFLVMR